MITADVADAIAEDAESLAALHDRELTPEMISALREARFPACLGLLPTTPAAIEAWHAMGNAVTALPSESDAAAVDELAAEYAAIYLTGAYGASPLESVWTDDDRLTCQAAMFQWRELHAAAGLAASDWRQRPDDHLVLQLLHLAHAARTATKDEDWRVVARILDEHTLRWLPTFAARVATRTNAPFYAALAALTASWIDALRDLVALRLNEPRPPAATDIDARVQAGPDLDPASPAYLPGQGPSW